MIDINELRRLAQAALIGPDGFSMRWLKLLKDFQEEANPSVICGLIDRLEAAESDALEQARLNGMGASREAALVAKLEAAEKEVAHIKEVEFPRKARAVAAGWETKCARLEQERDALRDRLALESQENGALRDSVDRACEERDALRAKIEAMEKQEPVASVWRCDNGHIHGSCERTLPMGTKLYALPGAKGE